MNSDPLRQAKNYCFLLLKFRPRSEYELKIRLKKKKFKEAVIRQALSDLRAKLFIDDKAFAKAWAESRLKNRYGLKRITTELRLKGIGSGLIEKTIKECAGRYSESEALAEITEKKLEKYSNIQPEKLKRRLFSYLIRRGFSCEAVSDFLNRL